MIRQHFRKQQHRSSLGLEFQKGEEVGNGPFNVFILKKYSMIFKQASLELFALFNTDLLPWLADVILAALCTSKVLNSATNFLIILVLDSMMCFFRTITNLLYCVLYLFCFHFLILQATFLLIWADFTIYHRYWFSMSKIICKFKLLLSLCSGKTMF